MLCFLSSFYSVRFSRIIRLSARLSTGTAVEISGVWKACPAGKEQSHELQTTDLKIVGAADSQVSCCHPRKIMHTNADQLTLHLHGTDISYPKEIPQPRFPSTDPSPPPSNTVQFPPVAVQIRMPIPAGKCVSFPSQWLLYSGTTAAAHVIGLRRGRGDVYRHTARVNGVCQRC